MERSDRAFLKALTLYEQVAQENPDDASVQASLANFLLHLGNWYHVRNDSERAEATFLRSLDIFERVARTHPDHVDDWYPICNFGAWGYGRLLREHGRSAEASALDRRLLDLVERREFELNWFDKNPGPRAMCRSEGYDGFMALSDLLVRCGQPLKAIPILERSRPHLVFNEDYQYYQSALANLSVALATDPDPVVRTRAVVVARENVEAMSGTDAHSWHLLGLASAQVGDLQRGGRRLPPGNRARRRRPPAS